MIKITALVFFLSVVLITTHFPFGMQSFVVTSSSMEPSISMGSLLYVKKADAYELGDVVTFKTKKNQVVTHRIIDHEEDKYLTQGDANEISDDEVVSEKQIFGKQIFSIPTIGYGLLLIKKVFVFLS